MCWRLELLVQVALGNGVGFPGWTGEPCLLRGTQVCMGVTRALHSATSMDSIALIAGNLLQEKSASSCLVPLRVGMISKRTRDRSFGRRVGTLLGKGTSQY